MQAARTPASVGPAWLAQCMRDVKAHKIHQTVRTHPTGSSSSSSNGRTAEAALPVRSVIATSRIHRGEHIGTVKRECVLTGQSASQLLQRVCRGPVTPTDAVLQPLSAQPFDVLVGRVARLPIAPTTPPHLLLSRDALLMAMALYLTRSPLHHGAVDAAHPMRAWADALPRRPPPMGALLHGVFTREADFTPLPRRLRLGGQTRTIAAGEDVSAASTELMVQAVESGAVALTELHHPSVETALTADMLTNYFQGRSTALTARQHATQRARSGAAAHERDAVHLFMAWEEHLQSQFVEALLPVMLTSPSTTPADVHVLLDTPEWQAEASALRWAHFTLRSRCVNLNWRRPGPLQLSLIPLVDMLNHSSDRANVVYRCEDGGDVALTAAQTIQAGEELVLRYSNVGQRGCLFGDAPRPAEGKGERREDSGGFTPSRGGWKHDAVSREVSAIERQQYAEVYTRDEDDEAGVMAAGAVMAPPPLSPSTSSAERSAASLAHREMSQEVEWLWRYGFLRTTAEKNKEAAQRWNSGLRRRIAHLTDVRRKGQPGEFVIGVPEGLQHLREQRAELEKARYADHRVFPPQQH